MRKRGLEREGERVSNIDKSVCVCVREKSVWERKGERGEGRWKLHQMEVEDILRLKKLRRQKGEAWRQIKKIKL